MSRSDWQYGCILRKRKREEDREGGQSTKKVKRRVHTRTYTGTWDLVLRMMSRAAVCPKESTSQHGCSTAGQGTAAQHRTALRYALLGYS